MQDIEHWAQETINGFRIEDNEFKFIRPNQAMVRVNAHCTAGYHESKLCLSRLYGRDKAEPGSKLHLCASAG